MLRNLIFLCGLTVAGSAYGANIYLGSGENRQFGEDTVYCNATPQENTYCECRVVSGGGVGSCSLGYVAPFKIKILSNGQTLERRLDYSEWSLCGSNAYSGCEYYISQHPECRF